MLAPFVGKSLGELAKCTFSSGICRNSKATLEGKKRAHIDDLAPSEGHHVLARSLGKDPAHLEVNVDNLQVGSAVS